MDWFARWVVHQRYHPHLKAENIMKFITGQSLIAWMVPFFSSCYICIHMINIDRYIWMYIYICVSLCRDIDISIYTCCPTTLKRLLQLADSKSLHVYLYIYIYLCWNTWLLGVANDSLNNSPPDFATCRWHSCETSVACVFVRGSRVVEFGRTVFVWWRQGFVVYIGDYTTLLEWDLWIILTSLSTHQ